MNQDKKRILLLEDNEDAREFYVDLLSGAYDVETANDGQEGLDKIKADPAKYNLLLLDIMMPKMDGVSFLRAKNKDPQLAKIPVVVLTNLGQEDVLGACFDLGVKFYILKAETTPDKILSVIKEVFNY